ncbi:gas vesicle protein [Streptomyces sp. NPDC005336]|uniref:gas vesicle protein n=1 Tax=unclassified Streptomyces TaxID=2593676 RepID=UPI0033A68874
MGERDPMTTARGGGLPGSGGAYGSPASSFPSPGSYGLASARGDGSANLADILERVLDKGVVIAGDIRINLLDIELLTIKLRLIVASVDKAKEMGIDWWEHDPSLSSRARAEVTSGEKTE